MLGRDHKTHNPARSSKAFPRCEIARHELDARTSVVTVEGELDLGSAPELKWTLLDAFEEGSKRVVLDLSLATFMDSTALGVLVGVERNLGEDEQLTIVCAQSTVLKIFELSGMDGAFAIFATLETALVEGHPGAARAS